MTTKTAQQDRVMTLFHVARGLDNPAVAARLGISTEAVRSRLQVVYRELKVTTRAGAVAEGLRRRWILPPPVVGQECPWALTSRQVQVIQAIADDHGGRGSGAVLGIEHITVRGHFTKIAKETGISSRARLVAFAYAYGLIA